jgi:UDP-N-acetylglucosamine 2-epimerase (non-hydrolysing)
MAPKTIVTISGIRPDFIRMSEIFKLLDQSFNHILIHSGQHVDANLSDVFFQGMKIREPDYNLGIGGPGKYHYHQLAEISVKIIELFKEKNIKPDLVMFLGDSNSVLASVVLKKEGYRIGHIEAGMRSYDDRMLEEHNRKVCDHMSDFLFVYHENYKQNLLKENISSDKIFVVGNTIVEVAKNWMKEAGPRDSKHILVDIHRPENFKNKTRMERILEYLTLFQAETKLPLLWLNFPRTMSMLQEFGLELPSSFTLLPLQGYLEFLKLQRQSFCIISDSGTAQEEPAILGVPVLVPRDFTERWESVEAGNSKMVNLSKDPKNLVEEGIKFVKAFPSNPDISWMGDGKTAQHIVTALKQNLSVNSHIS